MPREVPHALNEVPHGRQWSAFAIRLETVEAGRYGGDRLCVLPPDDRFHTLAAVAVAEPPLPPRPLPRPTLRPHEACIAGVETLRLARVPACPLEAGEGSAFPEPL